MGLDFFFWRMYKTAYLGCVGQILQPSKEQDGSSKQTAISRKPKSPDTGFTSSSYWHNQQTHTSEKLNFSLTKMLSIEK